MAGVVAPGSALHAPQPPAVAPGFELFNTFAVELVFLGVVLLLAIGALSRQGGRPFSASLVYLALGLVAAVLIQAFGLDWISPLEDAALLQHLTELALTVALFATGLKIERSLSLRGWRAVIVLIVLAMPLTIALVSAYGVLAMGLPLGAAIALGGMVAPTDPVLAGDVGVGAPGEEKRGDARFNLTGEAGLNDGLASPFVLIGVFALTEDGAGWLTEWLAADLLWSVVAAALFGAAAGYGVAAMASWMRRRELLSGDLDGFLVIGAVLLIYGVADAFDTYGFLAVFAAGMAFRRYEFEGDYNRRAHDGAEVASNFLELAVILLLGSVVTVAALEEPGLAGWLLAPVLLLLVRPALVVALLWPARMSLAERSYVGWLGVRGIATIYYAAFVLEEGVLAEGDRATVFWTAAFVVIVSIAVHGVSQSLVTRRLLR